MRVLKISPKNSASTVLFSGLTVLGFDSLIKVDLVILGYLASAPVVAFYTIASSVLGFVQF